MQEFYDDSSQALGLSYSWRTVSNPLLTDPAWNDRQNEKLLLELQASGEKIPPKVLPDGTVQDRDFEEQVKSELDLLEKSRPDLNFPEQLELARQTISAKQRQAPRNQGAYEDEKRLLKRLQKEEPSLSLLEAVKRSREAKTGEEPAVVSLRDYMGASTRSLMSHSSSGKGGSRSSRRRQKKRGTWICRSCHLEYCEHRPTRRG